MNDATTSPECPHCGYEFDDDETWYTPEKIGTVYHGDGDESELICPVDDCRKSFSVTCEHVVMFRETQFL